MLALCGGVVVSSLLSSLSSFCFPFSSSLICFVLCHLQWPLVCFTLFICFSFPSISSRSRSSDVHRDTISGGELSHTCTHTHTSVWATSMVKRDARETDTDRERLVFGNLTCMSPTHETHRQTLLQLFRGD